MSTIAIVPLRSPGRGKTRLATSLSDEHRAALAAAMFADVVAALKGARLDGIVVAAGGPEAAAAASDLGIDASVDPPATSTLDEAIAAATFGIDPGADLLIVAADLPSLTTTDVDRILAVDAEVVVAPTRDLGTGGLLRRPGDRIPTAYGPHSATRHRRLAHTTGATFAVLPADGFRDDVDTSADLAELVHRAVGPATTHLLGSWRDVARRTG